MEIEINMKGYNFDNFKDKDIYTWSEIISVIEDLEIRNYEHEEELKRVKQYIADNFERVSISKQVGISDKDFI